MPVSGIAAEDTPAPITYDAHQKRDPFTPLITSTSRQSSGLVGVERIDELNIEGIVFDPRKGSVVIVNGAVLRQGEELGNVKVVKIERSGVTLSLNGVETFKQLYQEEPKGKGKA